MADYKEKVNNKECRLKQFQRNNYFYGKLMTVRDFEDEQAYMNEKRYLINRTIHGSGIVCGFTNVEVKQEGSKVVLTFNDGGFGIDALGREIVVPPKTSKTLLNKNQSEVISDLNTEYYVYIKRKDCYSEMVPAASSASGCEERCCPNRIVEDFVVYASEEEPKPLKCDDVKEITSPGECPDENTEGVFIGSIVNFEFNSEDGFRTYIPKSVLLSKRLECHIDDKNNPHQLKHSQLLEILGIDPTQTDTLRDKHVSNADAKKWNSAIYSINNQKPDEKGNFTIEAGNNINIESDSNKIKISSVSGFYLEYPKRGFITLSKDKLYEEILHNFGRYPVVDIYEVIEITGPILVTTKEIEHMAEVLGEKREELEVKIKAQRVSSIIPPTVPITPASKLKDNISTLSDTLKTHLALASLPDISPEVSAIADKIFDEIKDDLIVVNQTFYLRKITGQQQSPAVEVRHLNKEKIRIQLVKGIKLLKLKVILCA